jgi:hypothetical protein
MIVHCACDADSTHRRLRLQPGGDVHAIAMKVSALCDDVAAPPRPTSIGTAGRLQSEWVADIRPESPADFVGMRTQSRHPSSEHSPGGDRQCFTSSKARADDPSGDLLEEVGIS